MIAVWISCTDQKVLDFWLKTFANSNKYTIYIYNNIKKEIDKTISDLIDHNTIIDNKYKEEAFRIISPYLWLKNDYIWNISDDIILEGNIDYYLEKIEELVIKKREILLNSDIYMSMKDDWSFGVCFANRMKMIDMIEDILITPISSIKEGIYINKMVDYYFKMTHKISINSFITTDNFIIGDMKVRYDNAKRKLAFQVENGIRLEKKHIKSALIR